MAAHPLFKGTIHDVGGPTANMYGFECAKKLDEGSCTKKRCLYPKICPKLIIDHGPQLKLLRALRKIKEGRRASQNQQKAIDEHRPKLEAYEALCEEIGEQPADVALAWMLHNPVVTAPIIGPRTIDQLEGSMRATKLKLKKDTLSKLDEIWPGPGGPAPEAYAW